MSKRIFIVVVLAAFAVCAVAVAQQRKAVDEARFGTVEVKRTHSHVIEPARTLVVPWHINYQGYLTDDAGNPINDTLSMTFGIWDDPGAGSELWNENQNVVVEEGLFNVVLGSTTPIPSDVFGAGQSRWLELTVVAQTLSPRTEITSVGYAYRAVKADSADDAGMVDGFDASATPGAGDLFPLSAGDVQYVNEGQTDAVTSDMIFDGTIVRGDAEAAFKAPYADTADYAFAAPVGSDNDWTITGSVLHPSADYGLAMRSSNVLYGMNDSTHVNLGIACTTGMSGQNYKYCTVSGGLSNSAGDWYATVGGGAGNVASDWYATVGGGQNNTASGNRGTVGGGENNVASDLFATIAGGQNNAASGTHATVGGGGSNTATDTAATVGGGVGNTANGSGATVAGGGFNTATDTAATVGGGGSNTANGSGATVAGGAFNTASDSGATVSGGGLNSATALGATVGGGSANTASGDYASVGGGIGNQAVGNTATVGGGQNNTADNTWGTVGGGMANEATGGIATVCGGRQNTASGYGGTVAGGYADTASGDYATAAGGYGNVAATSYATISGGNRNAVTGATGTVGGGQDNAARDSYTTVGGGSYNLANAAYATVAGGYYNTATGYIATVGGGYADTVAGDYSFATGREVRVTGAADHTFAFGRDFTTSTPNAVIFHNSVDPISVGIGTASPTERLDVEGTVQMTGFSLPTGAATDYVLTSDASGQGAWQAAAGDNDWTITGSVLYPSSSYGLAMRSFNVLYGVYDTTHVNFGIACTTGTSGQDRAFCTVSGGYNNSAGYDYAAVGGGSGNTASGYHGTVSGGENSSAIGQYAVVGGGRDNTASGNGAAIGGGGMNAVNGDWAAVGGGWDNAAAGNLATVGGGQNNTADTTYATVGGGGSNNASGEYATVGGGWDNSAGGTRGTVGGGVRNIASGAVSTIGGGLDNTASGIYPTVGGGDGNTASGNLATVGGGRSNTASVDYATVGGGLNNTASNWYATVSGGYGCTSDGFYSFTVGDGSDVPAAFSNSAAFNGQTATASGQTRVGTISKAAGTFTIDHPLDPMNKILNHYFVESPEMVLIYRGVAHIGGDGRAEVHLPNYFDALNRNPMVQLTGVGSSDVFVAEKVNGNRFVIGGKPGTEVYWTVTGDRKDQSAEITRIIMPVEQRKDGDLAGRSLDDDFLTTTKAQLEEMGQVGQFQFRTQRGRQKYEDSQRRLSENR